MLVFLPHTKPQSLIWHLSSFCGNTVLIHLIWDNGLMYMSAPGSPEGHKHYRQTLPPSDHRPSSRTRAAWAKRSCDETRGDRRQPEGRRREKNSTNAQRQDGNEGEEETTWLTGRSESQRVMEERKGLGLEGFPSPDERTKWSIKPFTETVILGCKIKMT